MPSPVGHILGGLIARDLSDADLSLAETAILAILPDLDFLPGMLGREPNKYHGSISHGLAAAFVTGAAAGTLAGLRHGKPWHTAAGATLIYGSHLLLDALGKEQEDGMPLLWPFSRRRWSIPGSAFRTIHRRPGDPFLPSLIHRGNRKAVTRELKILLPVYLAVRLTRRCRL